MKLTTYYIFMDKNLKFFLQSFALVLFLSVATISCGKSDSDSDNPSPNPGNNTELKVTLPGSLDIIKGQPVTLTQEGGGVSEGHSVYLELNGQFIICPVTAADDKSFTFSVPDGLQSGTYKFYIKRGTERKLIGTVIINIVEKKIDIQPGTTIYGTVSTSDGTPVAGVVVSDGEITTTTDDKGVYQLQSDKNQRVVFYSVPSGYEPTTKGVFPEIYHTLVLSKDLPENHSFTVKKVDNQDNFKVLYFGDMHLAQRTGDIGQFKKFTADVTSYKNSHSSEKIYAITLGDMTWDAYWKNGYQLPQYVNTINENIKNLTVYHTIGNHDHDPKSIASNFDATSPFMMNVAPAWYSFNIGKIHFIVLDNIDCSGYDGVKDRPYTEVLYGAQKNWLVEDLKHVDPSTPVYVMTHGSFFSYNTSNFNQYNLRTQYVTAIPMFSNYEVHFVNAHLHQQHTVLPTDVPAKNYSFPIYEHNIPAVCADWWYSGSYSPGNHVCTDGTPAGYAIFDFKGKEVKWAYKGTGRSEKDQFRVYDMNNVDFTYALSQFKNLTNTSVINTFKSRYVTPYADGKMKNKVLINVWNWNSDCKIEVKTKDGATLATTPYRAYDPLSILAMTIPYWDRDALTSVPGTGTSQRFHFFTVQCPDADTDIVVTTTDKFGNVCTEEIQRPYAFSLEQYKVK